MASGKRKLIVVPRPGIASIRSGKSMPMSSTRSCWERSLPVTLGDMHLIDSQWSRLAQSAMRLVVIAL
ncbi:hypothetical protein ACQ5SK_02540 [Bradyrhizobium japonicum]